MRAYGVGVRCRVPVVCVPGLTRNSRDFERVAPELAGDRQVLALDLRGRGRSGYDASGASYWVDVYASDVLTVMDAFGIARACLVGESLGGIVSMRVATIAGARVAGVVLNDIGPDLDPAGVARIFSYAGKLPPVVTWDDAVAQCRLMSEGAAPGLSDEQWLEIARQRFREDDDGTVVIDYDAGIATASVPLQSAADRWDDFASLRDIPTLSIRGATSDVLARCDGGRDARAQAGPADGRDRGAGALPDPARAGVPGRDHAVRGVTPGLTPSVEAPVRLHRRDLAVVVEGHDVDRLDDGIAVDDDLEVERRGARRPPGPCRSSRRSCRRRRRSCRTRGSRRCPRAASLPTGSSTVASSA